ncbi:acyltransferase family protein [Gordonia sp. PDNC005]|uniref:acyltransferase family protein n=1 Tax=unclassified Gordonia (in: high G+C Gram-positive bacteria) TaxID=2657482 RepID=UPI00196277AC|nr:acyltransferase family protein [Gordonia sp. PDNC005]QRY60953.1 acyltransferase family protein [Gordonia sp. PDNC005]
MPRPTHNESSYLPGLDGIRAVAVTVVLLYHLQVPGFGGGLLGVGVFFTLSGYLITSLLISTHQRTGGLNLKTFWLRRARRLLPAVVLVLIATLVTTAVVIPDKLGTYAGQALSALFYVNNWHTILSDTSYFERFGGPSPLSHMWSLSIEEQFYILWPLLLGLFYLVLRKRWLISLVTIGLALGSFYLLTTLAEAGFDNTRAYEGTDTRAGALLMGAALAFWWPARARTVTHNQRCTLDAVGIAGLAGVLYLCMSTGDNSLELYEWGIAVLTVATMGVLMAAVTPSTLVATVLSMQPFRWIGERSYGIYLWHMPLVAFLPGIIRGGSPLISSIVVVIATLVIASLSWRYVEDPIRRHGFRAALTTPRRHEDTMRAALAATADSVFTTLARPFRSAKPDDLPTEEPPMADEHPQDPVPSVTGWDPAASTPTEPRPLREEPVDVVLRAPLVEESVDLGTPDADDVPDGEPTPGGSAEPSSAETVRFRVPTGVTVLAKAPSVLNLPPKVDETLAVPTTPADMATDPIAAASEPPADQVHAPTDQRRSPTRAVLATLVVLGLAVGSMVAVSKLNPDLPIVSALYKSDDGGSGIDDELDEGLKPERSGPTLPADQRRTKCSTVIHVGDSTSIGMSDPGMQPNVALRLEGRYRAVGAKTYIEDVVGGRSSMERVNDQPNATESIEAALGRGVRGCWVIAMGINDTANVEVGGVGPVDMRIDNILKPLVGQPVLWPTVITNRLNENPAYDNRAMRNFNRALVRACKRYPNLRVYDWAGETDQAWFLDGVHYTEAGYVERARRFSVALATMYPATDLPPAGCVLKSTTEVVPPQP